MEELAAIDPSVTAIVGARSHDHRWVIVAVLDPTIVADCVVFGHVD